MSAAAATPFRSLVFRGTVPLQVQLEPQDLPLSADRSVGYYYLQVPRVSYLALCLDDIKRNLVQLVLDHAAFAALRDDDLWFETLPDNHQAQEGTPLKWHWPIGLLYDLHATSRHLGLLPPRPVSIPPSFASVFAPFDDEDGSQGQDVGASRSQELPELLSLSVGGGNATARRGSNTNTLASSSGTTLRGGLGGGPSSSSGAVASSSRLRTPSAPPRQHGGGAPPSSSSSTSMNRARSAAAAASAAVPASASTSISLPPSSSTAVSSPTTGGGNEVTMATRPWRIRLRIRNLKGANGGGASTSSSSSSSRAAAAEAVGVLDAGAEGAGGGRNRVEEIRTGFMALVKEADYVRWGSTKRVMNLRKELQDNLWEAVVENDFEKYWNVASKLVPLPAAPPAVGPKKPTRTTPPSASSSAGEGGRSSSSPSQEPDANGVKHVPLRVYLPAPPPPSGGGGASSGAGVVTVVQEPVAPTRRDGSPTTLRQALSQLVPLLFPPLPSSSSSSPAAPPPATTPPPPLAYPLIHGIYPPFETEVGWLGACMAGPDGWVNVVVVLDERGQPEL